MCCSHYPDSILDAEPVVSRRSAVARTRTWNTRVWRPLLYQLSYHYLTPGLSRVDHQDMNESNLGAVGGFIILLGVLFILFNIVLAILGFFGFSPITY